MTILRKAKRQQGFTITEMVVALALFGLTVVMVMGTMSTIQQAQRSEAYLDLANTAAREIIEDARNGGYDTLVAGQAYDRTSLVTEDLPGRGASLAVTASSDLPDIKKVDVDVSYNVGALTRHVYMTALIGKEGIAP